MSIQFDAKTVEALERKIANETKAALFLKEKLRIAEAEIKEFKVTKEALEIEVRSLKKDLDWATCRGSSDYRDNAKMNEIRIRHGMGGVLNGQ